VVVAACSTALTTSDADSLAGEESIRLLGLVKAAIMLLLPRPKVVVEVGEGESNDNSPIGMGDNKQGELSPDPVMGLDPVVLQAKRPDMWGLLLELKMLSTLSLVTGEGGTSTIVGLFSLLNPLPRLGALPNEIERL
jgi:hypothetical protein